MATIHIKAWHPEKAWASESFLGHVLFKRLEPVCVIQGTPLKRLERNILRRELVDFEIHDGAEVQSLVDCLASSGAEVVVS